MIALDKISLDEIIKRLADNTCTNEIINENIKTIFNNLKDFMAFCEALKTNTSVTSLKFTYYPYVLQSICDPSKEEECFALIANYAIALANCLTVNKSIVRLDLAQCPMMKNPIGIMAIATALYNNTSIKYLNLENLFTANLKVPLNKVSLSTVPSNQEATPPLDQEGNVPVAFFIAELFRQNKTITELKLGQGVYTISDIKIILKGLGSNESITKLGLPMLLLANTNINTKDLKSNTSLSAKVAKSRDQLREEEEAKIKAEDLRKHDLALAIAHLILANDRITHLDLSRNNFKDYSTGSIADALRRKTHLKEFNYSFNSCASIKSDSLDNASEQTWKWQSEIGNEAGKRLCDALSRHVDLIALYLNETNLSAETLGHLKSALVNHKSLRKLDLTENRFESNDPLTIEILAQNPSIIRFSCSGKVLFRHSEDADKLCDQLNKNKILTAKMLSVEVKKEKEIHQAAVVSCLNTVPPPVCELVFAYAGFSTKLQENESEECAAIIIKQSESSISFLDEAYQSKKIMAYIAEQDERLEELRGLEELRALKKSRKVRV